MSNKASLEEEEIREIRSKADGGDVQAQYVLADCYQFGKGGMTKDLGEAVKWFRKAADQGHAEAQLHLGYCYYDGSGVPKDVTEAVKWFQTSAYQGCAPAQLHLGHYYHRIGITRNLTEAFKWYRKAAEQGYAEAQYSLAVNYENGYDIAVDQTGATYWYRRAAEQGHTGAQYQLGVCYYRGNGIPQNIVKALHWFRIVARKEDPVWRKDASQRIFDVLSHHRGALEDKLQQLQVKVQDLKFLLSTKLESLEVDIDLFVHTNANQKTNNKSELPKDVQDWLDNIKLGHLSEQFSNLGVIDMSDLVLSVREEKDLDLLDMTLFEKRRLIRNLESLQGSSKSEQQPTNSG